MSKQRQENKLAGDVPDRTKRGKKRPYRMTDAEQRHLDDELDEALNDTFPASDPVQLTEPEPDHK